MNSFLKDITYLHIIKEAKKFHNTPKGLTSYTPVGKTDLTIIKQNNIIILLLINISQKLDKIQDKPNSSNPQDLEDLIKGINNLEIGKTKKSIAIPKRPRLILLE